MIFILFWTTVLLHLKPQLNYLVSLLTNISPFVVRLIMLSANAMDCLELWPEQLHIFQYSCSSLHILNTAPIRSHLEYCSSLYSSVAKTHLRKLDIIQKKSGLYHISSTLWYSRWTTSYSAESWSSQQQKRGALPETDWILHFWKVSPGNDFIRQSATGQITWDTKY